VKSVYVAIEGLDGTGKSTLIDNLVNHELLKANIQFSMVCPTRPGHFNCIFERIYRRIKRLRSSSMFRAILYAYRSYYASRQVDWKAPLILGDRSIVTSYVTRWRKWMNSAQISIWFVNIIEPFIKMPDHIIYMTLPDSRRYERLRTGRDFIEIDETIERSIEMKKAYDEIRYNGVIKKLRKTVWHTLDADKSPYETADKALIIIRRILQYEKSL
jgi:thymidylate kinase